MTGKTNSKISKMYEDIAERIKEGSASIGDHRLKTILDRVLGD